MQKFFLFLYDQTSLFARLIKHLYSDITLDFLTVVHEGEASYVSDLVSPSDGRLDAGGFVI